MKLRFGSMDRKVEMQLTIHFNNIVDNNIPIDYHPEIATREYDYLLDGRKLPVGT